MAATVDYLFGYDATAHVVEDWMYEKVTASYVADPEVRKFFEASNPWALRSIAERLLEANERGMWAASDAARRRPALRRARVRGMGGAAVSDPRSHPVVPARSALSFSAVVGQDDAKLALVLAAVRAPARRRAAAGPEGIGQDHPRPGSGSAAGRRRPVRRAAARRHRGPRRRIDRRRGAAGVGRHPVPTRPAWPRPTAASSTSTRSTCWPTTSSTRCSTPRCRA